MAERIARYQCRICFRAKPLEAFRPNSDTCQKCYLAMMEGNEKRAAIATRDRNVRRIEQKPDNLKRALQKYGLTDEQYEWMLTSQEGTCGICDRPPEPGKRLVIDHDHETGEVRMLLCDQCNTGLGMFRDDPTILRCAVSYLEAFQEDQGEMRQGDNGWIVQTCRAAAQL